MKNKINLDEYKNRIFKKWGNVVRIKEDTFLNSGNSCYFIDKDFGEFKSRVGFVVRGRGHKQRGILRCSQNNPLRVSPEKLLNRIKEKFGNTITIDINTYSRMGNKAKFIDKKYGEWWATPNNVIDKGCGHPLGTKEKIRNTFIKNYGVDSPIKDEQIFKKIQRSNWFTVRIKHWKDNREVLCRASFEYAVYKKLNELKIDYVSPVRFQLDKSIYYCDLYLPEKDLYIEIKGRFLGKGKEKWEEFHKKYPNSELWLQEEVENFVGKSCSSIKREFKKTLNPQKL